MPSSSSRPTTPLSSKREKKKRRACVSRPVPMFVPFDSFSQQNASGLSKHGLQVEEDKREAARAAAGKEAVPLSQKHLDSPPPSPSRPYLLTSPSSSFSSSSPTQILSLAEEQSALAAFDFTPTRIRAPHSVWSDELDPNGEIRKSMMSDELPLTTDYDEDEFSLTMDGFDEMVSSLVEELPPKKQQQQQKKKKKKQQQPPPSLSSSLLKSPHSDKWKVKSDEFNKMTGIKSVENWYLAKEIEILKKPSARHSTAETIIYDHRTSSLAPIDILAKLKLSQLGSVAALWAQTVVYTRGELAGNRLRSDIIEKYFGNCLSYIRRRHNREDDLNEKLGFQEAKLSCGQFGDFRLAGCNSADLTVVASLSRSSNSVVFSAPW